MSINIMPFKEVHSGLEKETTILEINYDEVEQLFIDLLKLKNLDQQISENPSMVEHLENAINVSLSSAYAGNGSSGDSHLFLQRVLYHINRMKLFWYDDLRNYVNECSPYITSLRDQIQSSWQSWEMKHQEDLKTLDVESALLERVAADLHPEPSEDGLYFRNKMTKAGYRRLLAIASLDGLVEASQLSQVLGGVGNEIQAMLTRLLLEEYGGGRLARKHSSFFKAMLQELDMQTKPEAYFYLVPWEVLANINHNFLLSDRKRYFLRYIGGLLYTEVSMPAAFGHYKKATERLGLSNKSRSYWDLHIKEDERHGKWMLHDAALPLIKSYKNLAWEMVWGYDQQKFLGARAAKAIAKSVAQAERR